MRGVAMDFIAVDFETANVERSSVCAVGIVLVKNNEVVEKIYRLVRPNPLDFDSFNIEIHGITREQVKDESEFNEVWEDLQPLLGGSKLVAHFASFDVSVLRYVLDNYDIDYPNLEYAYKWVFSKNVWPGMLRYDLATVSDSLGIELQHHHAASDAEASALIAIKASEAVEADSLVDLCEKTPTRMRKIFPGGYRPSGVVQRGWNASDITPTTQEFFPDHPCYEKSFVFTGTLRSMPRKVAARAVVDRGGLDGLEGRVMAMAPGMGDYSPPTGIDMGGVEDEYVASFKHEAEGCFQVLTEARANCLDSVRIRRKTASALNLKSQRRSPS